MGGWWKGVNKCIVCGNKLTYTASKKVGAKDPEGTKTCDQNHAAFIVKGEFDAQGEWHISIELPSIGKRYYRESMSSVRNAG